MTTTIKQAINDAVEKGMHLVKNPSPMRLRDLIRAIRAARTAADERAVVNKECAYIRSTFREEDTMYRCRNVAKLLYIHMLGYPAHFGQLECLKLIASPKFTDKRIGYLGAMLLLDERQDVHLLITNCLKNDLNSSSQFIVGLALCTLGAIASPEMSRDLAPEIEKLLKSSNAYYRKKAALCAFRIINKVPELLEMFLPATRSLLSEKNHGVLITGVILVTEMCERSPDILNHFKKLVPNLVRILKNLVMAGYSPEHDVSGVSDPFLQVKILKLLRILGRNDTEASETMNDILAQVATNTETSKNVGNAILYETVLSIMDIKSESGLRVLAINILGRFLLNSDKNIRYVALNTLLKTVNIDNSAVQRHRATIVECLKDPDITIKKRAMELCFSLMNSSNVKSLSAELLSFLEHAEPDFKSQCSSNMVTSVERYAPNRKWQIDTLLKILIAAGNYVRDDVIASTIQLVSDSPDLQQYVVENVWNTLCETEPDQQPLIITATWCIGEYGDLLFNSGNHQAIIDQLLEIYTKILWSNLSSVITKEVTLTSLMKLSSRCPPSMLSKIQEIIVIFGSHLNIELQQRSVEYNQLFKGYNHLRAALLERMPPFEKSTPLQNGDVLVNEESDNIIYQEKDTKIDALLDLIGELDGTTDTSVINPNLSISNITNNNDKATDDLVDLLGGLTPSPPSSSNVNIESNLLTDLLGSSASVPQSTSIPSLTVYEKNGVQCVFSFSKSNENPLLSILTLHVSNNTYNSVQDFLFQAAVPKTFQLQMFPPSGTVIPPNGLTPLTQVIHVTNNAKTPLKMRIKVTYAVNGHTFEDQSEINQFPAALWN